MFQQDFINNFSCLGERIFNWIENNSVEPILDSAIINSKNINPLFTPYMQSSSLGVIANTFLQKEELQRWLMAYPLVENNIKKCVGIIMAGNIPAVGFHDLLSVLATGRCAAVKLSSKDRFLIPALISILSEINPIWSSKVIFYPDIESFYKFKCNLSGGKIDSLIATGSNNTVQSVMRENKNLPMLLRGRRFSFAVISGKESTEELELLANDVFLYFGLGCRSINYLLVPKGYDFNKMVKAFSSMQTVIKDECYINCYKRARAINKMEGSEFIDGGFFLIKRGDNFYPPIAEISYSEYETLQDIVNFEEMNESQIQKKYCTFGIAQAPKIDEYADGVDTISFILNN